MPAGTYFVRVRGRNGGGIGPASNEVVLVVDGGGCASAPEAPSALGATVSGASVSLAWRAPVGGCTPTGYVIEAGSSSGATNIANFNTFSTTTTFAAGGVATGNYYLRVRAASGHGVGGASNEVIVTVTGASSGSVTGRWVGIAPDGWLFADDPRCGAEEFDLAIDLVQTGTNITGTFTNTVRVSRCHPIGRTGSGPLMTGTAGPGTITFAIHGGGLNEILTFTGTFSATRMTGITTPNDFSTDRAYFAVNRQ